MLDTLRSVPTRFSRWFAALSMPALVAVGVLIASGVGAGGYYAYRTYDYVQHDNDFCLSCHLMVEPYELFAQSAHRGLGCKACHQPTLMERSTMALTQVVDNPDTLGIHAEVPNERCEDCHVDGDPEKWALVASSAGHRVHFESQDSTLQGLSCVECHSTSVHEFAATDRTCAQSGCHTDTEIQLGAMSDLTIHCAACHGFSTPVEAPETEAATTALAPDRDTCLSCHVMRTLVELPDPDPHEGTCAACHNPHTQATPADAVESCATAGCHASADTISPFHRGLEPGALEDCTSCHLAHDFHRDGADCVACHTNILQDDPSVPGRSAAAHGLEVGRVAALLGFSGDAQLGLTAEEAARAIHATTRLEWAIATGLHPAGPGVGWNDPALAAVHMRAQEVPPFLHSEHPELGCVNCHETEERHGALTVSTLRDCRTCHHEEPTADPCSECHAEAEAVGDPYGMVRIMDFSVGDRPTRTLPFDHADHEDDDCSECHTEGLELSAFQVDCASCHEEHHALEVDCVQCHEDNAEDDAAHPIADAHLTCAGAGCHTELPFDVMPRSNTACLVCHQELDEHEPDGVCIECHVLPEPRTGG